MSRPNKSFAQRPFRHLQRFIQKDDLPVFIDLPQPKATDAKSNREPEDERQLFKKAMKDVKPIRQNKHDPIEPNHVFPFMYPGPDPEDDIIEQLHRVVHTGEGFVVAQTPEYREGRGHDIHPTTTRALHEGRFSIQAHIDLHGCTVLQAEEAFNTFMHEAIRGGKRAVLVVHGRGLSSPAKPVLKSKVHQWLSRGPWRKWVMAYTSARACDGGTGATYVLLRQSSLSRRWLKKRARQ